jgi:hypothetical protein
MTQSELNTFIDLFDTAITSDTPAVKKALRNLLLVASIDSAQTHSPFKDTLAVHSQVTSKILRDIEKIYDKLDLLGQSTLITLSKQGLIKPHITQGQMGLNMGSTMVSSLFGDDTTSSYTTIANPTTSA